MPARAGAGGLQAPGVPGDIGSKATAERTKATLKRKTTTRLLIP
jgi:hypothetical protein